MQTSSAAPVAPAANQWSRNKPYDQWVASIGVPVHTGYYIEDMRTVELGWWEERQCMTAFCNLAGQEGVTEVRISEVPAGKTTAPVRMALDELVYVADGRGITTIWAEGGSPRSFEWQKHSLFLLPRNHYYQLSSTQGDKGGRLLHYNSLPLAMALLPDPDYFFKHPYSGTDRVSQEGFYSEAKIIQDQGTRGGAFWQGNFFPDMRAWDSLVPLKGRGAGGHVVWIRYPESPLWNHMSVFPSKTYKKAHRHGPGTLIVIPGGEGFSYMWPEGREKVFIPWREASVFVPPNRWFHQHFNLGGAPARYLAFHAPKGAGDANSERVEDLARDQIEYHEEDEIVRQTFETELEKRGLKSDMPDQAYKQAGYEWDYAAD